VRARDEVRLREGRRAPSRRGASEFDLPLSLVREEVARSDLLPGAYARYRPLLADGLRFFLERLSPGRLRRMFEAQRRLGPAVSTAQRVVALLGHAPALHKLGQVVARDRRLGEEFRRHLQELESLAPQASFGTGEDLLDRQWRGWRKAGIRLGLQPLAEGSVALILPFTWGAAKGSDGEREGVFKVLKPGVEERLGEDLEILSLVGTFLGERCEEYGLPALEYRDTFDEIGALLLHEVRFEEEQANLAEAARVYAGMEEVEIPALLPFCSARLTAMERLHGERIGAGGATANGEPAEGLARVIARALVAQPICSTQEAALFHADPHAGNLLRLPGERLGILDWSLTGRLHRPERAAVVQLILGALALDVRRMEWAVGQLAQNRAAEPGVAAVFRSSLGELRWGRLPSLTWLTRLLDGLALRAGMRFKPNLLLFRKSLLTLEGVVADCLGRDGRAAEGLLDGAVMGTFLRRWAGEWPYRLLAPLGARSPSTHVSAADLFGLAGASAATCARWWSQAGLDALRGWRGGERRTLNVGL
jgi:ubiquinone biosynthesis protein